MENGARPLIPPHGNADVHKRVMQRLRAMTADERLQTLIDAGICKTNGELAEPYKSGGVSPRAAVRDTAGE